MYLNKLQFNKKADTCLSLLGGDIKLTPASSGGRSKPAKAKGKEEENDASSPAQATQVPGEEAVKTELAKRHFLTASSTEPNWLATTLSAVPFHVGSTQSLNALSIF